MLPNPMYVDKHIEIMPKVTDSGENASSADSATPPPVPPQTELSLRYFYCQLYIPVATYIRQVMVVASLPPRPLSTHVQEKPGRPGRFCDVMITYLPP